MKRKRITKDGREIIGFFTDDEGRKRPITKREKILLGMAGIASGIAAGLAMARAKALTVKPTSPIEPKEQQPKKEEAPSSSSPTTTTSSKKLAGPPTADFVTGSPVAAYQWFGRRKRWLEEKVHELKSRIQRGLAPYYLSPPAKYDPKGALQEIWRDHSETIKAEYGVKNLEEFMKKGMSDTKFLQEVAKRFGYQESFKNADLIPSQHADFTLGPLKAYTELAHKGYNLDAIKKAFRVAASHSAQFLSPFNKVYSPAIEAFQKVGADVLDPSIYGKDYVVVGSPNLIKGFQVMDKEGKIHSVWTTGGSFITEDVIKKLNIPWNSGAVRSMAKPMIIPEEVARKYPDEVSKVSNFLNAFYSGTYFEQVGIHGEPSPNMSKMYDEFVNAWQTLYKALDEYAKAKNVNILKFISTNMPFDTRIPKDLNVPEFPLLNDAALIAIGQLGKNVSAKDVEQIYAKLLFDYIKANPDVIYKWDWENIYKPFLKRFNMPIEQIQENLIPTTPILDVSKVGAAEAYAPWGLIVKKGTKEAPVITAMQSQGFYYIIGDNKYYTHVGKDGTLTTWLIGPATPTGTSHLTWKKVDTPIEIIKPPQAKEGEAVYYIPNVGYKVTSINDPPPSGGILIQYELPPSPVKKTPITESWSYQQYKEATSMSPEEFRRWKKEFEGGIAMDWRKKLTPEQKASLKKLTEDYIAGKISSRTVQEMSRRIIEEGEVYSGYSSYSGKTTTPPKAPPLTPREKVELEELTIKKKKPSEEVEHYH
ncbi:MAG: hypothetical protein QXF83_06920 [Candidatus Bathyarchaeia archaeon]